MADKQKWERKVAKLLARSWEDVRDGWLSYIPTNQEPGIAPQEDLSDLPSVQAALQEAQGEDPKEAELEIAGLRSGVLAEALFVLHKAANVLGSAQVHIERGFCSWSLSSAYHAAFFGMKAVLQFLGIVYIETGNQTYLVDVWSPPKRNKKSVLGKQFSVLIQRVPRFEHRHLWGCFQRMFRVSDVPTTIWPVGCVDSLKGLDIKSFARQRNELHYTTTLWPFQDLHSCLVINGFGLHRKGLDDGQAVSDPGSADFSIALGLVVVRMGCQMVLDLAKKSPVVRMEWELLQRWLQGDCHPLYQAAYPVID